MRFCDLTPLFVDRAEQIYSDACCHFTDRGNDLLVERIASGDKATDSYHNGAAEVFTALRDALVEIGGRRISIPYARYADDSRWRYWRYRFTEATGLSSF